MYGDSQMLRTITVYKGDNFDVHEQWNFGKFEKAWENGAIIRREMPAPSPKRPLKTKMVYYWIGEDAVDPENRKSMEMPPSVTERAAAGFQCEMEYAFSYRGIMIAGRRAFMVPA
jgi:hypothetical protein